MMPQQQKFIYLPLVGTILLCLLAIIFLMARKRSSKSNPSDAVSKHSVNTSPEKTLKYWTAEKMRHAKASELPNVPTPGRRKKQPQRPSQAPHPPEA